MYAWLDVYAASVWPYLKKTCDLGAYWGLEICNYALAFMFEVWLPKTFVSQSIKHSRHGLITFIHRELTTGHSRNLHHKLGLCRWLRNAFTRMQNCILYSIHCATCSTILLFVLILWKFNEEKKIKKLFWTVSPKDYSN